jgi:hypothetical protein
MDATMRLVAGHLLNPSFLGTKRALHDNYKKIPSKHRQLAPSGSSLRYGPSHSSQQGFRLR